MGRFIQSTLMHVGHRGIRPTFESRASSLGIIAELSLEGIRPLACGTGIRLWLE